MKRNRRRSNTFDRRTGVLLAALAALCADPRLARAVGPTCEANTVAEMRSQLPSWRVAEPATIDSAQRLVDSAGACSGSSTDPQKKAAYALTAALASEVRARALREQKLDLTSAAQTAYIMFRFVTNDKHAAQKDQREASLHLTAMSDLLAQSGIR